MIVWKSRYKEQSTKQVSNIMGAAPLFATIAFVVVVVRVALLLAQKQEEEKCSVEPSRREAVWP